MGLSVHLNHKPRGGTVKIHHASTDGVLAPELKPFWPLSKHLPQHAFGQCHFAPERTSSQDDVILLSLWRHLPLHHAAHGSPPHLAMGRNPSRHSTRYPLNDSCSSGAWAAAGQWSNIPPPSGCRCGRGRRL